jgi:hypothetical protein
MSTLLWTILVTNVNNLYGLLTTETSEEMRHSTLQGRKNVAHIFWLKKYRHTKLLMVNSFVIFLKETLLMLL